GSAQRLLAERRLRLEGQARGLPDPVGLIENAAQRLDDRAERLELAIAGQFRDRQARLVQATARLKHPREQLSDARRHFDGTAIRLGPALDRALERAADRLRITAERLGSVPLPEALERRRLDLAERGRRLDLAATRLADAPSHTLHRLTQLLDSLSPFKVLERGYAVVEDEAGHPVTAAGIVPGAALTLRFHDGIVAVRAEPGPGEARPKSEKKPKPETTRRQPTLF
ncbi:MAG: exodeoxyribonuclease VII large subunit, partial [Aliidongia sp.]